MAHHSELAYRILQDIIIVHAILCRPHDLSYDNYICTAARTSLAYTTDNLTEPGFSKLPIADGHGLGGVCDHSNHFGYYIKEILGMGNTVVP